MTTSPTALPELAESAAAPQIQAIYRGIRSASGVPMTALIWRHLATLPGVLEEAWGAIGPLFRTGALQRPAWRIADAVTSGLTAGPLAWRGKASAQERGGLDATLAAYNRANPVNLLGVACLRARLASGEAPGPAASVAAVTDNDWTAPAVVEGLPPMIPVGDIPPGVRRKIADLGLGDRTGIDPIVPSLYRHLVQWPDLVEDVHALLLPRFRSGEIAELVDAIRRQVAVESAALARTLPPLPRMAAEPGLDATLARFSMLIPEMIVVGRLIEASASASD